MSDKKTEKVIDALETAYIHGNDLVMEYPDGRKITIENAAIPTMRNIIGDKEE